MGNLNRNGALDHSGDWHRHWQDRKWAACPAMLKLSLQGLLSNAGDMFSQQPSRFLPASQQGVFCRSTRERTSSGLVLGERHKRDCASGAEGTEDSIQGGLAHLEPPTWSCWIFGQRRVSSRIGLFWQTALSPPSGSSAAAHHFWSGFMGRAW